jgi:hypothetical protein
LKYTSTIISIAMRITAVQFVTLNLAGGNRITLPGNGERRAASCLFGRSLEWPRFGGQVLN